MDVNLAGKVNDVSITGGSLQRREDAANLDCSCKASTSEELWLLLLFSGLQVQKSQLASLSGLTGNDGSSTSNSAHFLDVATFWALVMPMSQRRQRIQPQTLKAPSPDRWKAAQVSQSHRSSTHVPISTFKIKPFSRDVTIHVLCTSSLQNGVYDY